MHIAFCALGFGPTLSLASNLLASNYWTAQCTTVQVDDAFLAIFECCAAVDIRGQGFYGEFCPRQSQSLFAASWFSCFH